VQLIDAKTIAAGEAESFELYDRFLRMAQRCSSMLASLSGLRSKFAGASTPLEHEETTPERVSKRRISQSELRSILDEDESKLDALGLALDKLASEIESMGALKAKLELLQKSNIDSSILGARLTFAVLRAGVVSSKLLQRLESSLDDFLTVREVSAVSAQDSLLVVMTSRGEEKRLDELLAKYDFREIDLPRGLDADPKKALVMIEEEITQKIADTGELEKDIRAIENELSERIDYVNFLRESTTVLSRTKDLMVAQGWVIESAVPDMRKRVAAITSNSYYLEVENPKRDEQTPVLLANRGWLLKGFELLTSIRGMPSSNELDPTIIFALLFPIMYGMMFGDVGDGAVILVLGLILYRSKKGFIGLSAHSVRSLGTIMVVGGFSGIIFGFLYGSVFLTSPFKPLLFEPITSFETIVEVALIFGVIQVASSLILNIRNQVARGDVRQAVFSGKGVLGLAYYILGIILAVRVIQGGLNLSIFVSGENLPITIGALVCLLLVFLSPALRNLGTENQNVREDLVEGLGEFIEVFISFMTNSLSYLRLAAFAIAHSIFASFALNLGSSIGLITSLVLVNALVIMVDGFAAGIQSIRLLYYEFSTKFFAGSGERFKPLNLKLSENDQTS
jgi:vacuolar-type H+-ATPase subunit I/STV1